MNQELPFTPEEIKVRFNNLKTLDDLAELLDIPASKLYYYAYKASLDNHYKQFDIPKKSGGKRRIYAPSSPLKIIQKKLSQIFQAIYFAKAPVQGFIQDRSILTNASRHLEHGRKKFVFNADLENFFPTISLLRVTNLLIAKPYNLPEFVAHTLARLTCYMGFLPQGAPSSPVVSNMICAKMDTRLRKLAQANKCTYTRYADDITISTNLPTFPGNIASYDANRNITIVGTDFQAAIQENGFRLNEKKLRLQTKYRHQEITGLTVNAFPNVSRKFVRQIRAMLFAWEKFGFDEAQREYREKYSKRNNDYASFAKVIRGKLEFLRMVKGNNDPVYKNLQNKLAQLDPEYANTLPAVKPDIRFDFRVLTEGQSDWKHLKTALLFFQAQGKYKELAIEFIERDEDGGDGNLLNHCKFGSPPLKTEICIFDRDKEKIVKQVTDNNDYKKWNSRMYSFAIPVPTHRRETPDVCIELYYKDADLTRPDKQGRRLFLSNEFFGNSGKHKTQTLELNCTDLNKIRGKLTIIDSSVFDSQSNNVALPKNDFARFILEREPEFSDMDFSEFSLIFDLIRNIMEDNPENNSQ
jgi:RNA-directed DNA polymerase